MKKTVFILCFLLCVLTSAFAQDQSGRVLAANAKEGNFIQVKWLTQALGEGEEFQVFRRAEGGAWELLNAAPIKKAERLDILPARRDDLTTIVEDLAENGKLADAPGLGKLMVVTKWVQSNEIAEYLGLYYEDRSAKAGTSYEYKVSLKARGRTAEVGLSSVLTAGNYEPIAAVQNAEKKENPENEKEIRLSWQPEEQRYFGVNVYRKQADGPYLKVNRKIIIPSRSKNESGESVYPDFFYNANNHRYGVTYSYHLRPVDFFGNEGLPSEDFEFLVVDKTPVLPVRDVAAVRLQSEQIIVTWAPSPSEGVKGYNVFFGSSTEGPFTKVNEALLPPESTEQIINVENWGDFYCYVEAVNSVDIATPSAFGAVSVYDDIPPVAPSALTASAREGFIDLEWERNKEKDLLGYVVFRSVVNDGSRPFERITPDPITRNKFSDKLPKAAKNEFYYKVAAVDTAVNLSPLSAIASAVMPDVIAPEAPTVHKVELTDAGNTVQWFPSLGDDLKGYEVYRCTGENERDCDLITAEQLSAETIQFLDTEAEKGINTGYRVLAEDLAGNRSELSNIFIVKTKKDSALPGEISRVRADFSARNKVVTVKWNEPKEAARGSMVYRKEPEGRFLPVSGLIADANEFKDKKIQNQGVLIYQVRTYFNNGTISKSEAVEVEVK